MSNIYKIKEIAKKAGVSTATVSNVINSRGRFSAETERKVQKVIKEYGYIPNLAAKGLRKNNLDVVAIIVPNILNTYYANLVQNVEANLFRMGYSSIICNTNDDQSLEYKHIKILLAHKVSGVIFIIGKTDYNELKSVPTVYLNKSVQYGDRANMVSIISDNFKGGYLAMQKLVNLGNRKILIVYPYDFEANHIRIIGAQKAIEESNGKAKASLLQVDSYDTEFVAGKVETYCKNNKVDGFMCVADILAMGVYKAMRDMKRDIHEYSITGYDDSPICSLCAPTLTSVKQYAEDMARMAADSIVKLMNGKKMDKHEWMVDVELIERESTK